MNYFDINNIPPVELVGISITHEMGKLKASWNDVPHYLIDDSKYIDQFAFELKSPDLNPSSVLIGGLGLGTMALWLLENKNITTMDIVESNEQLVTWTNTSGHLNPLCNVIEADALLYTPTQNYDLIIMDLWFPREDRTPTEMPIIKDRYIPYLNEGGCLYIPLDYQYKFCN